MRQVIIELNDFLIFMDTMESGTQIIAGMLLGAVIIVSGATLAAILSAVFTYIDRYFLYPRDCHFGIYEHFDRINNKMKRLREEYCGSESKSKPE